MIFRIWDLTRRAVNSGKRGLGFFKVREQSFVGVWQFFRKGAGFTHNRNKIRISCPSGNHVHVKMVVHAGACRPAEIEAHIIAMGVIFMSQDGLATPTKLDDFPQLIRERFAQKRNMAVGNHEQVPRSVGVQVNEDEGVLASEKYQILLSHDSFRMRQKTHEVSLSAVRIYSKRHGVQSRSIMN